MKVISDPSHGILDYLTVAIFALAPSLLGFGGVAALISYGLAGIHLAMTLLTDMPLGPVKLIPMKLHALVEMIDRKSTRLNSSHQIISYAVFCLKKKNQQI